MDPPAIAAVRQVADIGPPRYLVVLKAGADGQAFAKRLKNSGASIAGVDATLGIASVVGADRTALDKDPDVAGLAADPLRPMIHDLAARAFVSPAVPGNPQPFQSLQWGLDLIHAPEAWATGDQGQGVTVAVLDTGVDADNPNLAPNLDLVDSKSFVPQEDLTDLNGHGSHVAGIIAAARNGTGVAGVAPEAKIMSVKVLDKNAYGDDYLILEGIRYAADHGAAVLNLSLEDRFEWGSSEAGNAAMAFERAIRYATMQGSVVVAGTGNDAEEERVSGWVHLPADLPLVLGVSAVGPVGQQNFGAFAPYSNWGSPMVQVAAPGGGIALDPV
ncbi:MAG: S8 family serine peptidase, partial [Cyanobacteria bacterium REEB65]|nr:S8 family serine peptidase [Cyanobacteria bacterium REEB65]